MSIKIANLPVLGVVADACNGQHSSSLTREQMKAICGGVDYSNGSYPVTMVIPPLFEGGQNTYIDGIPDTVASKIPASPLYYFIALQ